MSVSTPPPSDRANLEFPWADGTQPAYEDDTLEPDLTEENPYPGADTREWTARFSAALASASGLPREITDGIAPYVVRPKRYLMLGRKGDPDIVRLWALSTNATGQKILTVDVHGFAGNAGEYNERIRREYESPFKPGGNPDRVLPTLVTGRATGDRLAPYITTAAPVPHDRLNSLLGAMNQALDATDGAHGYRLDEDIEIYGQQETTLHVALLRQISEPDGETGHRIRHVVDLTAVKGANRTRARLKLFGLTPEDMAFGVRPRALMGTDGKEAASADPRVWVPVLAGLLRAAYEDPAHPGHAVARRAAKVAVVPLQIIIGAGDLDEFHNTVYDPNRVDHRRPPLDYTTAEKAASDLRALLRDYKAHGYLSEAERAWLAGEGPDPSPVPGESVVDARDRRDRALLNVVFPNSSPGEASLWQRARTVLGEPARSQTGRRHVDHRARMFSAVASDGYQARWNPRVLDGLHGTTTIRHQLTYCNSGSWRQLLDAAGNGDLASLGTFITTRGMHWLAERHLIEADRGSAAAQAAGAAESDDDEDERGKRIRRTMANVRDSLQHDPVRAIGLFRELAHAANSGSVPRTVEANGNPVDGATVTRDWFDATFPKHNGNNRRMPPPGPPPVEPARSPQQVLLRAREDYVTAVTCTLTQALCGAFRAGRELIAAADAAGQVAFPDTVTETIESLEKALLAAGADVRALASALPGLKYKNPPIDDYDSRAEAFLQEVAE